MGFAEHQHKWSYGLDYKPKLQRNNDIHVLSHLAAIKSENLALAGRFIIEDLSWYVPHYTPNISTQKFLLGYIVSKAPTELSCIKRSS